MKFEITNKAWHKLFDECAQDARNHCLVISPFLGKKVVEKLFGNNPNQVRVLTRFNLDEMSKGSSDIQALDFLLSVGAQVRGIKHLHSKVYIFGSKKALITSANLTHSGLFHNYEYGVLSEDPDFVRSVTDYFEELWAKATPDLTENQLTEWKNKISESERLQNGGQHLGDYGADIGFDHRDIDEHDAFSALEPHNWFIKLVGTSRGNDRLPLGSFVRDVIYEDDVTTRIWYPKNKHPIGVRNGDLAFIGRLVKPADVRIFGRARVFRHIPGQDEATQKEVEQLRWKADWPHFVRMSNPEFIRGRLADCVSLYEMIDNLGTDMFRTTRERALKGEKDIHVRGTYGRQPAVWLTAKSAGNLNRRLDQKFANLGRLQL